MSSKLGLSGVRLYLNKQDFERHDWLSSEEMAEVGVERLPVVYSCPHLPWQPKLFLASGLEIQEGKHLDL